MQVSLHKNARTTPAIRRELRASTLPTAELARRYNLSKPTVRKWRRREDAADRSHRPHRLHATLSPPQEAIVVALRQTLLLPLDDLLAVTHECVNESVSRAGLDRCLRRHGVSNLQDLIPREEGSKAPRKTFKDDQPGFVHVDLKYLPQMPEEEARRYLFVAIDRATRWVYLEVLPEKSAACARGFLERLLKAAPFKIATLLTDNGKAFTDRFCATGQRVPTGNHPVDRTCNANAIEHRLIKPRHPQTNGLVERFNGRIAEVLATTRFRSGEHLADTLLRYAQTYNHHLPQRALGHITPVEALQNWVGRVCGRDFLRLKQHWVSCKTLFRRATTTPTRLGQGDWVRSNPLPALLVLVKQPPQGRRSKTAAGKRARSKKSTQAERSAREPWLLVASPRLAKLTARQVVRLYRQRMQIEEAFRDLKSQHYGEGLERSRSRRAGRFTVLVLIASLAAFLLWLLGTAATHQQLDQRLRPGSRKRTAYSRLFLARLLLTLQSYRDLIKELVAAVVNADHWVSSYHGALSPEAETGA
jgi:transposase InsO family protein